LFGGLQPRETLMAFYREHIYTHLVRLLSNPKPIRDLRQQIIPAAEGTVLEIGVGSGVNFPHYDPARVSKLYALEPNQAMIRLAERHRDQTRLDIEFLDLPGERIPLSDGAVDTVVSTFTLCTIPGVAEALRGIARVLRPGGKLIFFEVGLAPERSVQRWQRWWEPIHRRVFVGLYLTRDIPSLVTQAGFAVQQMQAGYVAAFPKSWAHCCWGTAIRPPEPAQTDARCSSSAVAPAGEPER
jgi:SAM-dependent methyltransferase